MREEATKSRLRHSITPEGEQVLMIGSESIVLTEGMVDMLIAGLGTGKEDARDIKTNIKKNKTILKQYNHIGKTIDDSKLRIVEEGEINPGVVEG